MKVIIVGGSIAGLTLAHSLDRANIEYEVLDGYPIAPAVGASIAIFQNGAMILDQLGIYEDLLSLVDPLRSTNVRFTDGRALSSDNDPSVLEERFGYSACLLTRQRLIRLLYDKLENKSRVHAGKGKKVVRVEQSPDGVEVFTDDGSVYKGDMVAGCDGIHSTVRGEMWRYAHAIHPERKPIDEATFKSQYRCLFGISDPVAGLIGGQSNIVFGNPASFLTFIGLKGEVFFFLYQKMSDVHTWPNSPRFSKADAEEAAKANSHIKITENVTFGDIWEKRNTSTLLAMDEGVLEDWHFGRFAIVGDAAHKMTVNLGQGGNNAIESAAALANSLQKLATSHEGKKLSAEDIDEALCRYQTSQKPRLLKWARHAHDLSRQQGLDGYNKYLIAATLAFKKNPLAAMLIEMNLKTCFIDYLPPPSRFDRARAVGSKNGSTALATGMFGVAGLLVCYMLASNFGGIE